MYGPKSGSMTLAGHRRPLILVTLLTVFAVALALVTSAEAAPRSIASGYLDWGIKASFRSYITGPIAHGTITLAGGATQNGDGTYRFPAAATGTYDSATGALVSSYGGSVHFLGHDGQLDLTVSNLRVQMSGATSFIVADITSLPLGGASATTYSNVQFVDLNLTGITPTTGANTVAWANVPSTLNTAGVTPFAGFYTAGTAFDNASVNLTLAPDAPTAPVNNLTWKVSEQVWTSSSLTPLHEAGNGAVKTTNGFVFPVSSATFNTTTHETHIVASGYLQFGNTAQGNYRVRIANPSVDITAAGAGTLTADVSYRLTSMADFNTPARVVVVNFQAPYAGMTIAGNHGSWSYTPDFPLIGDPAHPDWKQFPATFLAALDASLQSHFRQSGSTSDPNKAPAPLSANFDFTPTGGGPTGPTPAVQTIKTNVQTNGALSISVGGGEVTLATPLPNSAGDKLVSTGALNSVTVLDQRLANPGWNVSGQLSNFSSSAGSLDGKFLGWTPNVVSSSSGQTVTAGSPVAAGVGFTGGAPLGSAAAGLGRGTAVFGAGLSLEIPTDTAPAEYSATLTLTVI